MKLAAVGTILLGVLLIALLAPLSQFLTLAMINSDLETAGPAGWAVGLLTSIVLVIAVIRVISRRRMVSRTSLVLLYCMLTIAVPMMNMGLVRAIYTTILTVQKHYVMGRIDTYRTAYEARKPSWFPVAPTTEGLAWNKADRLLRILQDRARTRKREDAKREVILAVSLRAKALARGEAPAATADEKANADVRSKLDFLGVDEVVEIQRQAEEVVGQTNAFRRALVNMGLFDLLTIRLSDATKAGADAADRLMSRLGRFDEHEACYVPSVMAEASRTAQVRYERDLARLPTETSERLKARVARLEGEFKTLREDTSLLSFSDFVKVRNRRKEQFLEEYAGMDAARLTAVRASFVFRSTGEDRSAMCKQNGDDGTPNQNIVAFDKTVFAEAGAMKGLPQNPGFLEKLPVVLQRIPWGLWSRPLLMWSLLVLCIFLFLMCLAEWLRRKWVDRENLAFPLVEIADNIIRHDYELESAEDVTHPRERRLFFNPLLWVGALIGAAILMPEALCNYNITSDPGVVTFDVSGKLFATGFWKEISGVFFVLSPIAIGLLFLVSLEVSLSIFVIYWIYKILVAIGGKASKGTIVDSVYCGWGAGMNYPFEMEQLLGACLCFAAIVLYKSWRSGSKGAGACDVATAPYVPAKVNMAGLIVIPLLIGALLWNMGMTNIPFTLFLGLVAVGLAIAGARVRAETGLPAQYVTYEFTKLPIIFGLTGLTGAKVFALFTAVVCLPVTLLFRLLPQQLENIELARRNRVGYPALAVASLVAFVTAVGVGLTSFLVLAYYKGSAAYGDGSPQGGSWGGTIPVFTYSLWVSHFLGEASLNQFTQIHWVRIWFILAGIGVFGGLALLRYRFIRFPLHPIGYLLILLSIHFPWVTPYFKSPRSMTEPVETSWLWGSALAAWVIKKLIVKYGGMNTYKKAKPLFIGLALGAILCVFAWNMVDLVVSLVAANLNPTVEPTDLMKTFTDKIPYNPIAY